MSVMSSRELNPFYSYWHDRSFSCFQAVLFRLPSHNLMEVLKRLGEVEYPSLSHLAGCLSLLSPSVGSTQHDVES